jgi:hypothetical protein
MVSTTVYKNADPTPRRPPPRAPVPYQTKRRRRAYPKKPRTPYTHGYSPRRATPPICSEVDAEVRRCRFNAPAPFAPAPAPAPPGIPMAAPCIRAVRAEFDRGRVVDEEASFGSPEPPLLRDPLLGAPEARFLSH